MKRLLSNAVRASLLSAVTMLPVSAYGAHAQQSRAARDGVTTTLTLVSEPGDTWTDEGGRHYRSVLTFGHYGCNRVDARGFCTGGSWPTIPGAHCIWSHRLVSPAEALYGTPWLTFTKSFVVPPRAMSIQAHIAVDADNVYELYLNGSPIGSNGNVGIIGTHAVSPRAGKNTVTIRAFSWSEGAKSTPYTNPAGFIYAVKVSFIGSM